MVGGRPGTCVVGSGPGTGGVGCFDSGDMALLDGSVTVDAHLPGRKFPNHALSVLGVSAAAASAERLVTPTS
ncbi:hypothetical protein BOX37_10830 [Nocardia mangyaensis]|uniref:Uncharacterized protein n=1 Tax=Nocardia mangyaensis TaxID=2213200 RepID=A0A1J0VQQ4_9NOCA|nr:hypothetical protein BOX37_10830 [Nocardia mangyaensis]